MFPGAKGVPVEIALEELQATFPEASAAVLAETLRVLSDVRVDLLSTARCTTWGDAELRAFEGAVREMAGRAGGGKAVAEAESRAGDLAGRLTLIGERLAEPASRLLRRPAPRPDGVLAVHREALETFQRRLAEAIPSVEAAAAQLARDRDESAALADRLDAEGLAAYALAPRLPVEGATAQEALLQRATSLAGAAARLRDLARDTDETRRGLHAFLLVVREVALVELSRWVTQAATRVADSPAHAERLRKRVVAMAEALSSPRSR